MATAAAAAAAVICDVTHCMYATQIVLTVFMHKKLYAHNLNGHLQYINIYFDLDIIFMSNWSRLDIIQSEFNQLYTIYLASSIYAIYETNILLHFDKKNLNDRKMWRVYDQLFNKTWLFMTWLFCSWSWLIFSHSFVVYFFHSSPLQDYQIYTPPKALRYFKEKSIVQSVYNVWSSNFCDEPTKTWSDRVFF